MQIRAEPRKSALPICNYSQILYQFLTFTQNLKRSQVLISECFYQKIFLYIDYLQMKEYHCKTCGKAKEPIKERKQYSYIH